MALSIWPCLHSEKIKIGKRLGKGSLKTHSSNYICFANSLWNCIGVVVATRDWGYFLFTNFHTLVIYHILLEQEGRRSSEAGKRQRDEETFQREKKDPRSKQEIPIV